MMRSPKKGPSKHLEKMLFINHKEDMLLQDRLADLNLRSKLRVMDLDRERIQVRRELRNSRKRNIDVRDASALGLVTANAPGKDTEIQKTQKVTKPVYRKHAISAPPGGRLSMISENHSEIPSTAETTESAPRLRRQSSVNRLSRETSLPDICESFDEGDEFIDNVTVKEIPLLRREVPRERPRANSVIDGRSRANSIVDESVGAYVLGEFRRMSQVVPSILRALNNKDEEEGDEEFLYQREVEKPISLLDYEPDLHKVTKTVSAVKKLRHRMSVSKKLDAARPIKPLDQMIREKTENIGVQDEYTDGACVLMKRRLDKKRRNSATPGLLQPSFMQRRQSLFAKPESSDTNKTRTGQTSGVINFPRQRNRSQSVYGLPKMSRSPSVIGLMSNMSELDNAFNSPVIDEDEFLNRQKVLRELDNYRRISVKVGAFLATHDSRRPEYAHVYAI